jgi:7-cyano-7-deazaguanine reductase
MKRRKVSKTQGFKDARFQSRKSSYEGLQDKIRGMKTPPIDTWHTKYADKEHTIHLEIPEFTCICPKTGLPDFANIIIEYIPAKLCIELKSFKLYLHFYRNIGIFHEHLTNKILDDFVKACKPRYAKITTKFHPRGGIYTMVTREHKTKSK